VLEKWGLVEIYRVEQPKPEPRRTEK